VNTGHQIFAIVPVAGAQQGTFHPGTEIAPPAVPVFHAFSYAQQGKTLAPRFVIAGSGEVSERGSNSSEHIVARSCVDPQRRRHPGPHGIVPR
jgi:hypothetical protein